MVKNSSCTNVCAKISSQGLTKLFVYCSADGTMLPPMTVYKSATGSVYTSWCEGGPAGSVYAASKSGWFDMQKFNQWFQEVRMHPFQLLDPFKMLTVPYLELN
jgi:hypothetical protein